VSDSGPHQFDAAALRDDVRLIARLFGTSGGKMVATGFGEDPCGTSMLTPRVVHGNPADPDAFADALLSMAEEKHRNVYVGFYVVNEDVKPGLKGSEDEVRAVVGVVADFDAKDDPRAGEWAQRCPEPPTMVIQSSGIPAPSVQCRFLFSRPASPEQAKRIAVMLADVTGADPVCKDVCHVWRPAGLLNWPNRKKVKAGRPLEPQPVRVIVPFDAARLIDPDTFEQTLRTLAPAPKAVAQSSAKASGAPEFDTTNPPRTADLAELDRWKVPNWCRVVIARGTDPDEPTKYPSRSEALFGVVCELTRCGVPREVVFGIITDPTWTIAASVTDKGSDAVRYALRQLDRAGEHAIAPELAELNERHAVIRNYGGKTRVIEEVYDEALNRYRVTKQTFDDFRNSYMNRKVIVGQDKNGNAQETPLGEWWLRHGQRRQYDRVVFEPERDVPNAYNLWRGFGVEARPGDCSLYLNHLRCVVCGGYARRYEYLLNWMSRVVQHPGEPGQVAIVLRGVQGCGKGTAIEEFGSLFGRHYLYVGDEKHLIGNFNAHRRDAVVMFADECFYAGNKKHRSLLKSLITERVTVFEGKGVDAETGPNYVHLFMASNEDWVVPVEDGDRRFVVYECSPDHAKDIPYFKAIREQMECGGRQALLYLLLNRDISAFNVWDKPHTTELAEQIRHGLEGADGLWFHLLALGEFPCGIHQSDGSVVVSSHALIEWARDQRRGWERVTPHALAALLGKPQSNHVGKGSKRPGMGFSKRENERPRGWIIPPLPDARKRWDECRPDCPGEWDGGTSWDAPAEQLPDYGGEGAF
jgi:Family of unknown function (DUF5906)